MKRSKAQNFDCGPSIAVISFDLADDCTVMQNNSFHISEDCPIYVKIDEESGINGMSRTRKLSDYFEFDDIYSDNADDAIKNSDKLDISPTLTKTSSGR